MPTCQSTNCPTALAAPKYRRATLRLITIDGVERRRVGRWSIRARRALGRPMAVRYPCAHGPKQRPHRIGAHLVQRATRRHERADGDFFADEHAGPGEARGLDVRRRSEPRQQRPRWCRPFARSSSRPGRRAGTRGRSTGRSPCSTVASLTKLWVSRPAPTSSTVAITSCPTTRAARMRDSPRPAPPPRDPWLTGVRRATGAARAGRRRSGSSTAAMPNAIAEHPQIDADFIVRAAGSTCRRPAGRFLARRPTPAP